MDRIDEFPSHKNLHPAKNQPEEVASYLAVWEERRNRVISILIKHNCRHILDLGCGEGRLFQAMKFMPEFKRLVGIDIDINEISKSYERVGPITYHIFSDDPPEEPLEVAIYCGDLTIPYPSLLDERSEAITMVEVIEHLPADVLERLPNVLFGFYRPEVIIISTPNKEYNQCIKGFDLDTLRHYDHKFEWTRKEFQVWCEEQMKKFDGYEVTYQTVGRLHPSAEEDFWSVVKYGRCTQIAVFKRRPGADGPYDGDLDCFDESSLEIVKNFKFPSKQQIENLKISHTCSKWSEDYAWEPDHYEYSECEDSTDWRDDVDPEWWKAVWNKKDDDDDEKAAKSNGQGWDDGDEAVHCWQLQCDFKSKLNEVKNCQCENPWPEDDWKVCGNSELCSPSSGTIYRDDDKVSGEEDSTAFSNPSSITSQCSQKQPIISSNGRLHKQAALTEEAQKWEYDVESKALEQNQRARQICC